MSDDWNPEMYALANGRDIESVFVAMHGEVVWANEMDTMIYFRL